MFNSNSCTGPGSGAVTAGSGSVVVNNSTFEGNSGSSGGAIYITGVTSFISRNVTYANNTASFGGAIRNDLSSGIEFYGNLFFNNVATSGNDCFNGTYTSAYNVSGCASFTGTGDISNVSVNTSNLGSLTSNFQDYRDHRPLISGNPAINIGVTSCASADQTNYTRTDGACDAGAFEYR